MISKSKTFLHSIYNQEQADALDSQITYNEEVALNEAKAQLRRIRAYTIYNSIPRDVQYTASTTASNNVSIPFVECSWCGAVIELEPGTIDNDNLQIQINQGKHYKTCRYKMAEIFIKNEIKNEIKNDNNG